MNKHQFLSHLEIILMIAVTLLAGCSMPSIGGSGPTTWIDRPLDGETYPIAELIIQAHAADVDGVARMEFLVMGKIIDSVVVDGTRFEEAQITWMPPTSGIYIIEVRAYDSQGNSNARTMSSIQITISDQVTGSSTINPETILSETQTITSESIPSETPTPCLPTVIAKEDATLRAGPDMGYGIVGGLISGQTANLQGRSESVYGNWWYIQVPNPPGGQGWVWGDLVTTVCVPQDLPVVTAMPLISTFTPTPIDNTPPTISEVNANPTLVSAKIQCGATPPTTIISAKVIDASDITRVFSRIPGLGEFDMTFVGSGIYQVNLGPFDDAGTLSIFIHAQDKAGNISISPPISVVVVTCPG